MLDEIYRNKKEVLKKWEKDKDFIYSLSSEDVFELIFLHYTDLDIKNLLERDFEDILYRCITDFDLYNYLTLLCLKFKDIQKDRIDGVLNKTVNLLFSKNTIIYLMKQYRNMEQNGIMRSNELFNKTIEDLKEMPTDKSSRILFDLYLLMDYKSFLLQNKRVLATLIDAYHLYDKNTYKADLFNGSTIIGKLLDNKNELIVAKYLRDLLKEKQISTRNIEMIGGGGSSLVFKIGDKVIKLGETRNDRKIFINHRILSSYVRKLEYDENEKELFYVEIMKHCLVGDVTPEERDELKRDLDSMGLVWDDDKLENCGVLPEDYDNISEMEVDFVEVLANIDYPERREEFNNKKRRVVVIDNDHIRFNPMKSWR